MVIGNFSTIGEAEPSARGSRIGRIEGTSKGNGQLGYIKVF